MYRIYFVCLFKKILLIKLQMYEPLMLKKNFEGVLVILFLNEKSPHF